jgi:hypothetical protein
LVPHRPLWNFDSRIEAAISFLLVLGS